MDDIKLVKIYMDDEIKKEVNKVLDTGNYIKGPNLKDLEDSLIE